MREVFLLTAVAGIAFTITAAADEKTDTKAVDGVWVIDQVGERVEVKEYSLKSEFQRRLAAGNR